MARSNIDPSQILVTGAGGMVGRALPWGIKLLHSELEVCDGEAVQETVHKLRPAAILHLSAVDIHRCETEPLVAMQTNVLGTWQVARAARSAGIPIVFLSSGAVFNGRAGMLHDETAQPDPVNIYGQTKHLAEIVLRATYKDSLVIRTGWLFGGHQAHHQKFVERAIELARRGEPILGTSDEQGSPTWVADLSDEILRLITEGSRGTFHVANSGIANGYDLAVEIVRTLNSQSEVQAVRASELSQRGPRRAASEALTTQGKPLRSWQASLKEYVSGAQ